MRLSMAQWPAGPVEPSGRPRTARRWFSNWLVTAPSMLQWPELWTRGAISLTRSSPSCSKNSRARTPTYFRDSRTRWAALSAERWMPASRRGAGAGDRDKTLEDKGEERHLGLGFGDILRGAKNPLALAVVAHARSFKDRGKADGFYGGVEF